MLLFFLLTVLLHLSEQHLSYPINYCNMAKTCIHDSRVVCASSPDGCTRRSFLDQCDMYEYNCDYNTRYQETYLLFCSLLDFSTKFVTTSDNDSKDPDEINFNELSTHIDNENKVNSTLHKQSTLEVYITTTVTNLKNNTNEVKVICCNRPKTWETTSDITITSTAYNFFYPEITEEETFSSSTIQNIHNNHTFTPCKKSNVTINSNKSDNITASVIMSSVEILPPNKTTAPHCPINCNRRPITWETTTDKLRTFISSKSDSRKEQVTKPITTYTTAIPPIITSILLSTEEYKNHTTDLDIVEPIYTLTYRTKMVTVPIYSYIFLTRRRTTKSLTHNCKTKCQRPSTWRTTRRPITDFKRFRNYNRYHLGTRF
ncbi:uncharacterized protein LOC123709302 isoform X1 [Pieris brassicae]|uniref:uncharacterized protein LOC123709302 isoform X1 n=2 Tax=Pieris brassicae TaxID=7116 RepID=UPI001E65ECB5|nr:uncharacterized protein LOC123709302 isoform X1 [Pieris brassicae]